jgi:uncharacterized membrane protein
MKLRKSVSLFSFGAVGYGLIEIIWRGFTHPSMLLAGGTVFLSFSVINQRLRHKSLFVKALLGATVITAVELGLGIVFNILLKKRVWDYSDKPFNFLGQICPLFSVAWFFLSIIFIPLEAKISKKL